MGKKDMTDDEEDDHEGREIKKTFTKKSKKINRPVFFLDTPFKIIEKIPSLPIEESPCIQKSPFTRSTQCGTEYGMWYDNFQTFRFLAVLYAAEDSSNTLKVEWNIRGVSHREGGWPKEIDSQVILST